MHVRVKSGQPIKFRCGVLYKTVCCECGLVHTVLFSKSTVMTSFRNDYETQKKAKAHDRRK